MVYQKQTHKVKKLNNNKLEFKNLRYKLPLSNILYTPFKKRINSLSNVLTKGGQKARIINEISKVRFLLSDIFKLTRYEIDFFLNLLFRRAEPIKNLYRVGKSAGFRIKRESRLVPDINKRIMLGLKFIKAGINKRQQRNKCSLANAIFMEFMLLISDKTVRKSFISEFCEIHSKQMYRMTFYHQLEREKIERNLKQSRYSERAF